MRRRHQSILTPTDAEDGEPLTIGPSAFLPARTPYRFRTDSRTNPEWRKARKFALRRDRFTCGRCGRPASEVDHVVELIDGGAPYQLDNLQSMCGPCHDAKTSESRYRRTFRATTSWGRLSLCPQCDGSGRCAICAESSHPCGGCLGVRFVPESCRERGELPSQALLAEVSPTAWAGAEPHEG